MYQEGRSETHEVAHVSQEQGPGWREAHRELQRIAARRGELDADEARWLLVARETRAHRELGYGSFHEYVERTLGCTRRTARERIRVAERLAELPVLRGALARGETSYSVVRELTRVAEPGTEAELLAQTLGKTVREVQELVAGDEPRPHRLTLELPPQVYALFREARRMLEAQAGSPLDDGAVMTELCQAVLEGRREGTHPRHQLAVTVCARCDRATADAAGEVIPLAPSALSLARCDATRVGQDGTVTVEVPRKVRRAVERRDHHRCRVPGCRASIGLHLHHLQERGKGGEHVIENLILLCASHHDANHAGKLRIVGSHADDLVFEHADRRPYGQDDVFARARGTLRRLGYTPDQAASAAEDAREAIRPGQRDDLDEVVRACLRATRGPG